MKRLIIFFLLMIGMISGVSAIDYDNITFTNEEFLASAITGSKVIELSTGDIAVGYISGGNAKLKICDSDGTNCGTEIAILNNANDIDLFEDTTNNKIVYFYGGSGSSIVVLLDLDGTNKILKQNLGKVTNYVSAVQINSTDFAIGFQDTADTNKGKLIICKLDGSSCESEIEAYSAAATYIKIVKTTTDKIMYAHNIVSNGEGTFWQFNLDGTGKSYKGAFNTGGTSYIDMIEGSDNKLKIVFTDGGDGSKGKFISCDLDGTNCGSEISFNTYATSWNNIDEFNEKLFFTFREASTVGDGRMYNFNLTGGDVSAENFFGAVANAQYIDTMISTDSTLIISHGDSTGSPKGRFSISESLSVGATVTINEPVDSSFINTNPFTLNITTDLNTNLTYSLNGASNITLGTNINSSILNITGIEGNNLIIVYSNYTGEITNSQSNFTLDTLDTIIINSIPSEINSYEFLGSYFSCSDTNLDYCNISIDSQNKASGTNFTISQNGNQSYTIFARDLAGNEVNGSGTVLVNPYFQVYFKYINNTAITNFSIDGILYDNYFNDSVYTYGLGNQTFLFEKAGLQAFNFTISLTDTSEGVEGNFTVLLASIFINLFNDDTKVLIPSESFSLQLSGPAGYIFQSNGTSFNITSFVLAGTYTGLISSTNFESKEIFFTYTSEEIKELDVYFIPLNLTNLGFVTVEAFQADNTPAKYISAYAKQWFASESVYRKVQETKTGGDGKAELKIILEDYIYQFCIYTETAGETCTGDEIIKTTENGQVIPITEESRVETQNSFSELLHFSENIQLQVSNVTGFRNLYVQFDWKDLSGFNLEMCYTINKDYQYTKELVESACIVGALGDFEQIYLLNSSYAYIVDITATIDGTALPMYHNTFNSAEPSESIEGVLEDKGMRSLALVLYIAVIMTIIALLKNPFHGVVVIFVAVLGVNVFFSSLMNPYALSALMTFCGMTAWGLRQLR